MIVISTVNTRIIREKTFASKISVIDNSVAGSTDSTSLKIWIFVTECSAFDYKIFRIFDKI